MNTQPVASIHLQGQASSLLLYQSVPTSEVGCGFLHLLQALRHSEVRKWLYPATAAGSKPSAKNQSWQDYLITQILSMITLTRQVQQTDLAKLLPAGSCRPARFTSFAESLQMQWWFFWASGFKSQPGCLHLLFEPGSSSRRIMTPLRAKLQQLDNWVDAEDLAVSTEIWHWAICISGFALAVRAASIPHPDPVQLLSW